MCCHEYVSKSSEACICHDVAAGAVLLLATLLSEYISKFVEALVCTRMWNVTITAVSNVFTKRQVCIVYCY